MTTSKRSIASRAATTRGSFGVPDLYNVWDALTPRSRNGERTAFLANNSILTKVRRFDTTGSADLWVQLADGTPPTLLGKPVHEASAMTSAVTSGSRSFIAGDLSEYLIVDRLGTTLVEVPMVMGASQRPTYQKGYAAYYRVGAKVINPDAFRLLLA